MRAEPKRTEVKPAGGRHNVARGLRSAIACLLSACVGAWSAPVQADESDGKPTIWNVTVGGYGLIEPKFDGAKHSELAFKPMLSVRKEGAREWMTLPNDGIDFELFETDNFRAGPVANWRWNRDVSTVPRGFRHIGSVDLSIEGGAFAEFWPAQWLRTRAEVRNALIGADGFIADLSSDVVWRTAAAWRLTAGPRLSLADKAFMDAYYSLSPAQATAAGLPQYSASAGVRTFGAGTSAQYKWDNNWTTTSFVEYQRYGSAAASSPLIDLRGARDQYTFGVGLSYNFNVAQ